MFGLSALGTTFHSLYQPWKKTRENCILSPSTQLTIVFTCGEADRSSRGNNLLLSFVVCFPEVHNLLLTMYCNVISPKILINHQKIQVLQFLMSAAGLLGVLGPDLFGSDVGVLCAHTRTADAATGRERKIAAGRVVKKFLFWNQVPFHEVLYTVCQSLIHLGVVNVLWHLFHKLLWEHRLNYSSHPAQTSRIIEYRKLKSRVTKTYWISDRHTEYGGILNLTSWKFLRYGTWFLFKRNFNNSDGRQRQ